MRNCQEITPPCCRTKAYSQETACLRQPAYDHSLQDRKKERPPLILRMNGAPDWKMKKRKSRGPSGGHPPVTRAQASGMSARPHAFMKGCSKEGLPVIRAKDYPFGNVTLLSCQSVFTPGPLTPE